MPAKPPPGRKSVADQLRPESVPEGNRTRPFRIRRPRRSVLADRGRAQCPFADLPNAVRVVPGASRLKSTCPWIRVALTAESLEQFINWQE